LQKIIGEGQPQEPQKSTIF